MNEWSQERLFTCIFKGHVPDGFLLLPIFPYILMNTDSIFNSGVRMCVERPLKEAVMVDSLAAQPDKGIIGKTFKKDAKTVQEALAALTIEQAEQMDKALSEQG